MGGWRATWQTWRMTVWVLLMPHLLMLPFIGALTNIYLTEELGASTADLGLVESANNWLSAFGAPVIGVLLRRWGLKGVVLLHMISFIVGAVLLASLGSWRGAILVGAVQGFEATSVALVRVYFFFTQLPPPLRGRAAVMVGLANKMNYIVAPWVGALIFELTGSYRAIFLAQAAFCLLPMALLLVFVPWKLGRGGKSFELTHASNTSDSEASKDDTGEEASALDCRGEISKHVSEFKAVCSGSSSRRGLVVVIVWGVLYKSCQVAWHSFIFPLRLREAGFEPTTINLLRPIEYFSSFPVLLCTGAIMERHRNGLRFAAASFGGMYGVGLIAFSLAGPELWSFILATIPFGVAEGFGPSPPVVWAALSPQGLGAEFFATAQMCLSGFSIVTPWLMGQLAAATSLTVLGFVTGAGGIFTFWFCWTFVPPQPTKVQLQQRDEDAPTKAAARDDRESEMASLLRENE